MLKEFKIGGGRTINLGNFNNIRIEAQVTYEVTDASDVEAIHAKAQDDLKALLRRTYTEIRKEKYE